MRKLLFVCVLSASLFSCSLLQRHSGGSDEDGSEQPSAPATESANDNNGPLFTPTGQEVGASPESEVSRLNTKIAALETKVDVLSANLERLQAQRSQPVIQAEPQANLAAPVDVPPKADGDAATGAQTEAGDQTQPKQVSAAPVRPARHLPAMKKDLTTGDGVAESSKPSSAAEREFRAGMQLFQNGQNLEAASRFALMAKKFPHHMLAAHALYWAGESAARAQQWSIATENWGELEKKYPHSAYIPEALAGLARAYDAQGDASKSKLYRSILQRSFPKSPVAMKSGTEQPLDASSMAAPAKTISRNDGAAEAPATSSGDEPAPVFEEDNSAPAPVTAPSAPPSDGSGAETQ